MANIKKCENGHEFDSEQYQSCPFCPGSADGLNSPIANGEFKKTQILGEQGLDYDITIANEEASDKNSPMPADHELNKTPSFPKSPQQMLGRTNVVGTNLNTPQQPSLAGNRKLVGWLVTFNNNELGDDYRLYIGKNIIGSGNSCDVKIQDQSVSAENTIILFRSNDFLIKDNFSTNGTIVNGNIVSEGMLKDGDEITIGNTTFKFKTVF